MDNIILILLIVAAVKFIIIAVLLLAVFKPDLKQAWKGSQEQLTAPVCLYCQSRWTRPVDEGQTRWDEDVLVLVTEYECEHCHLPFWHVERVLTTSVGR